MGVWSSNLSFSVPESNRPESSTNLRAATSKPEESLPADAKAPSSTVLGSVLKDAVAAPRERFLERDSPIASRVMRIINVFLGILFTIRLTSLLFDLGSTFVLIWVATAYFRDAVQNTSLEIGVFLALYALLVLHGRLLNQHPALVTKLFDGPPAFRPLGGLQRSPLRAAIRASRQLRVEFDSGDRAIIEQLTKLDLETTETVLKSKFLKLDRGSQTDQEERWRDIWEHEVLDYRVGEATLRETFGPPSYASILLPLRLLGVRSLVSPIFKIFQVVLVWSAYRYLNNDQSLLSVLQIGIVFSVTLSMLIYLNHSLALSEIQIIRTSDELPEAIREQAEPLIGRKAFPTRISILSGYFESVGRYFLRVITVGTFYNAFLTLSLLALSLGAGVAFAGDKSDELLSSYGSLALALVLIPVAMVTAHYAVTLLIQYLRHFAAVVIGGLVTALLPLGIQYAARGSVPRDATTVLSASTSGSVGAFATAIGTMLTNRFNSSPEKSAAAPIA